MKITGECTPVMKIEGGLSNDLERIFDDFLSVYDIRDQCSLSGSLDRYSDKLLVTLAVACQSSRHDLESLAQAELE